jgi:hypothetical protein
MNNIFKPRTFEKERKKESDVRVETVTPLVKLDAQTSTARNSNPNVLKLLCCCPMTVTVLEIMLGRTI